MTNTPRPMEWVEVDGRMVCRPMEPREPMGEPPSMGAPNMRCVTPDFDDAMPVCEAPAWGETKEKGR